MPSKMVSGKRQRRAASLPISSKLTPSSSAHAALSLIWSVDAVRRSRSHSLSR
jgi:hypothetical protein